MKIHENMNTILEFISPHGTYTELKNYILMILHEIKIIFITS